MTLRKLKDDGTLFTADIGKGKLHVFDSKLDIFHGKLPKENLPNLKIPNIKRGDILVIEDAHLRESHKFTLAQPYSFLELTQLKSNCDKKGVLLLAYPQQSTPNARKFLQMDMKKKSDEVDTRAIANVLINNSKVLESLKVFVPIELEVYREKNEHIFDYIKQSNEDLNPAKTSGYGFATGAAANDYSDDVSKWINNHVDTLVRRLNLNEIITVKKVDYTLDLDNIWEDKTLRNKILLDMLGLKFDTVQSSPVKVLNASRIYTFVHSIIRPDGGLRFRLDIDKVPHWKFIKAHYLGQKPFHRNQGVAASNYKHWLRKTLSEYSNPNKKSPNSSDFMDNMSFEEKDKLNKGRTKIDKAYQEAWNVLRQMIVEEGIR